jgi:hypothetical protein
MLYTVNSELKIKTACNVRMMAGHGNHSYGKRKQKEDDLGSL